MQRKKSVIVYSFKPSLAYVKKYLQKAKPGRRAPTRQKDEYAIAFKCVKEMEKVLTMNGVNIMMPPGCEAPWPISPTLSPPIGCVRPYPLRS